MIKGLALRFSSAAEAASAARFLRSKGVKEIEGYGPFPDEELAEALQTPPSRIPLIALIAGLIGGVSAYYLQYWTSVQQYAIDVGGRPLHSWPAFIPVTFELTVLSAACSIFVGFLILTGLPNLTHHAFSIPGFEHASDDKFFLFVRTSKDGQCEDLLPSVNAEEVYRVRA